MSIVTDENMGKAMSDSVVEWIDRGWMDGWVSNEWMLDGGMGG